jgi:hypothetical protein
LMSHYFSRRGGFIRFGGRGVFWTNQRPYFSERNGYKLPFLNAFGWRFFWIDTSI